MRICFVTSSYPVRPGDQTANFVEGIALELVRLGHKVYVVAPRWGDSASTEAIGNVRIFRFPFARHQTPYSFAYLKPPVGWIIMAMFVAQSFRYSFKLGKRFDVELFHAHWTIPAGLVALIASRLLRKPFVVSSYGSDLTFASREPLSRAIISVVLKRVNHFIGLSKELDTIAKELGVPAPRATIIPDGVRPELFAEVPKDRTEIRKHLQLGNGPVVLYVGRLDKMKGLQYLLEAMTLLSKAFSKRLTLLIVGDGPEKLHLKQLAESASYRTRFVGPVPHTQIPEILSIADVCVLPSMSEGLSSFLEEAMFAGRPIVATCVGGTPDIISSGVNGLLVDPADSVELSQAIRRILSNRTFAQQLGRNARKFAEENLTTETTVHSILSIYQRVANKPL